MPRPIEIVCKWRDGSSWGFIALVQRGAHMVEFHANNINIAEAMRLLRLAEKTTYGSLMSLDGARIGVMALSTQRDGWYEVIKEMGGRAPGEPPHRYVFIARAPGRSVVVTYTDPNMGPGALIVLLKRLWGRAPWKKAC